MTDTTRILARHAQALDDDALPESTGVAVKTFVLDTLAVGLSGAVAPHAEAVRRTVHSWGTDRTVSAPVWGTNLRLPPAGAAFVNCFQAHCQEFDCVHEGAVLHPLTVIVPALMAEAERSGPYSGRRFMASVAIGVDLAVGLGQAAQSPIRFFRPATAGLFGATLALARMTGMSEDETVCALGHALGQMAGTMQAHEEGKPVLPLQIGGAARAALVALDWTRAGIPAPEHSLDGKFGYLPLIEVRWSLDPVIENLGTRWRIDEVSHKPYPTGRAAHGGIDAMGRLIREHGVTPDDIDHITLTVPPLIKGLVGRPVRDDLHANYARLCLPFAAACALYQDGHVGLPDFTPEGLNRPEILAMAKRIQVIADDNPDPAAFVPQHIEAVLKDGTTRTIDVTTLPGTTDRPLTRVQAHKKVRDCAQFSLGANSADVATQLIERIDMLETLPDITILSSLLSSSSAPINKENGP